MNMSRISIALVMLLQKFKVKISPPTDPKPDCFHIPYRALYRALDGFEWSLPIFMISKKLLDLAPKTLFNLITLQETCQSEIFASRSRVSSIRGLYGGYGKIPVWGSGGGLGGHVYFKFHSKDCPEAP